MMIKPHQSPLSGLLSLSRMENLPGMGVTKQSCTKPKLVAKILATNFGFVQDY